MFNSKMAVRPYLEAIKHYCAGLSQDALTNIIMNLAKESPLSQRQDFLSKLNAYSSQEKVSLNEDHVIVQLCDRIQALKEDIQERSESIIVRSIRLDMH